MCDDHLCLPAVAWFRVVVPVLLKVSLMIRVIQVNMVFPLITGASTIV